MTKDAESPILKVARKLKLDDGDLKKLEEELDQEKQELARDDEFELAEEETKSTARRLVALPSPSAAKSPVSSKSKAKTSARDRSAVTVQLSLASAPLDIEEVLHPTTSTLSASKPTSTSTVASKNSPTTTTTATTSSKRTSKTRRTNQS